MPFSQPVFLSGNPVNLGFPRSIFADFNIALEPIREVWIHDEGFTASRLSMMRIIARRTKATTVGA